MEELQKLGEELVGLKPAVLEKFPLSEELREAVADAQRFKTKHVVVSYNALVS